MESGLSPERLWQMFSGSDLLDGMRPEYWDRPQPAEITHIVKEIFRQIAIRNRWGYRFESPRRHDMVVWYDIVYKRGQRPAFVLESENQQEPRAIETEIEKLAKSEADVRVGVFYAWPKYDSRTIVKRAKEFIRRGKLAEKGCTFLLILGYTRPSDRPKNHLPQTYGYEAYAIGGRAQHYMLGTKQICPKEISTRSE